MLSKFAKLMLISTTFAPILFTQAFKELLYSRYVYCGLYVVAAALLALLCYLFLKGAEKQLERMTFEIKSLKTADAQIVGFVIAYLLPLASSRDGAWNPAMLAFVIAILIFVVWTTHAYHFNPVLGAIGFHFYEVTTVNGVTFILISRRTLRDSSGIKQVVQLTDYIVLDVRSN